MSTEPIVVFRLWEIAPGPELRSAHDNTLWQPGVNRASCHLSHRAPVRNCRCGLYGYRKLELTHDIGGKHPRVLGAVLAAGLVQQHEFMIRAEVMKVIAFQWPPIVSKPTLPNRPLGLVFTADRLAADQMYRDAIPQAEKDLRQLAADFWVPLYDNDEELLAFAYKRGRS
jgi:hypothetical protein